MSAAVALDPGVRSLTAMCHTRDECKRGAVQLYEIANESAREALKWRRRGQIVLALALNADARLMRFLARGLLERRCD